MLARYSAIEASTKAGKTVGCIAWLFEQAFFGKPGRNYWWVAPVYGQAKIAFTRMKRAYPEGTFDANESDLALRLIESDTLITFKSGEKADNLYGEDVYAAVIDEASRVREESWHAIRSTITATRGPVRFIGNVKGRKNWFYAICRKAESGAPGMAYYKITAADAVAAKVLAADEIDDAKTLLPAAVFKELYEVEPSDDVGNPFGFLAIRECVKPALSTKPPIAWAWDLAKSVDWTVGGALDEDGNLCRFVRFQKPWTETTAAIIKETGGLPAVVDSTGVGDPILEALQKEGRGNFEGFKFSSSSKQQIMEGLALAIQKGSIGYPDGPITNELEQFEYEYTRTGVIYSAPEGFHDDCVCMLALLVHKRNQIFSGWGIFEFYKRGAAEVTATREKEIIKTTSLKLEHGAQRLEMPKNITNAYGISGKNYSADATGTFIATAQDAEMFRRQGFVVST